MRVVDGERVGRSLNWGVRVWGETTYLGLKKTQEGKNNRRGTGTSNERPGIEKG